MKFIIVSQYSELMDLADYLANVEKHEVCLYIQSKEYGKIGDGMVKKIDDLHPYIGQGYTWIIDGCAHGKLQDWLREQGEAVFGGSKIGDELENNRQKNQTWFKLAGFRQPFSKNFKNIDDAISFVKENTKTKWILKQNGDAPKSISHKGKFDSSEDMIFHLQELKKSWSESEFGDFNCDLMEIADGMEVAASVFFNGKDYMKNADGKVVGFINWEEKKECDGEMGETCGEMGTTFMGVTEDNQLFRDILIRPVILEVLRKSKFRGVFDINCIQTKEGIVALEPTMRPGIPSTSYEFIEGMASNTGEMIDAVARGKDVPIEVNQGYGMVMCVVAKPFPVEADVDDSSTSVGEKLWILNGKKILNEFTADQRKHIHLYNFFKKENEDTGESYYSVATKNGYLLTVSTKGKDVESIREGLIEYIKDNLYLAGMKYRTDIGNRVEGDKRKPLEDKIRAELEPKMKEEVRSNTKKVIQKLLTMDEK